MKRLFLGALSFLLACGSGSTAPKGSSGLKQPNPNKIAPQSSPAPVVDNSVMGDHFRFLRPAPDQVLRRAAKEPGAEKAPPALSGKHLGAVYDLIEFSLQVQLTEAQKKQLKEAVLAEYEAGGERRDGILSAPLAWAGMKEFYKKAPSQAEKNDLLEKNQKIFIEGIKNSPDYLYRRVIEEIIAASKKEVAPGPPVLTAQQLDSLLEAIEFLASIYLAKPFTFLVEDREAMATAIIKAYGELPQSARDLFIAQERHPDLLWTLLRAQWIMMDRPAREAFREGLVGLFGYPIFQNSEEKGAKALMALPDIALSAEIRNLFIPKLGPILEQMQDIPTPDPVMMGYIIYDY